MNKQMRLEGGFQGRTNKLVDGCYSFWQGGSFPLINAILSKQDQSFNVSNHWLFNQEALQEYILICCQNPHGGLLDKPGKYVEHFCIFHAIRVYAFASRMIYNFSFQKS